MDTLGVETIEAVVDRGNFKIEDIEACERAGITAYVPRPIRGLAVNQGYFAKELFHYDPAETFISAPVARRFPDAPARKRPGRVSLTALAYNIKRAITIVGVQGLIAAVGRD